MRDDHDPLPTRRDSLTVFTGAFAAVGGAVAAWPFIDQMNPHPGTPPGSVLVDLVAIQPGQTVTVTWRAQPILIRHRTSEEVQRERSVPVDALIDPYARNAALRANAPASDANRTHAGHPQWLVVVGLCTHLGCRLRTNDAVAGDDSEGWFCPCHAARFDMSGRVRGGPARTNLPVPRYRFITPSRIEIGRG